MKLLLSILMLFSSMSVSYPADTSLSVLTDFAYIYVAPDLTSSHVQTADGIDLKLEHGDKVIVYEEGNFNQFYKITCIKDNVKYGVSSDCYIYSECVAKLENEQEVVLTYNAETSIETIVYSLTNGENGELIEIGELKKQTQIYLYEGFNRKSEFTNIKFSYNGKILLGKIRTEDIKPYGINSLLIISVTAIFACVSVILILLGINKKSLRKKAPVKNQ